MKINIEKLFQKYPLILKILISSVFIFFLIFLIAFNFLEVYLSNKLSSTTTVNLSISIILFISFIKVLLVFLVDIKSFLIKLWPDAIPKKILTELYPLYTTYLKRYYNISAASLNKDILKTQDIFLSLTLLNNKIKIPEIVSTEKQLIQRKQIILAIFYTTINDDISKKIYNYFGYNLLTIKIREIYNSLTKNQKKELITVYYNISNQRSLSIKEIFSKLDDNIYNNIRFQFFDKFFKDSLIKEITDQLNFSNTKIGQFKKSFSTIATEKFINKDLIEKMIDKKKFSGRLFIFTGKGNPPLAVEEYIKSCPHYNLNYTQIVNIPGIGKSAKFVIYFFSPPNNIDNHEKLFKIFKKLDKNIVNHPFKIYEVNPFEGKHNQLTQDYERSSALKLFETYGSKLFQNDSLSYEEAIYIMQNQKISVHEVLYELPPSDFSTIIKREEKEVINKIIMKFLKKKKIKISELHKYTKEIKNEIKSIKDEIEYEKKNLEELYDGKIYLNDYRKRLTEIVYDINSNITSLADLVEN